MKYKIACVGKIKEDHFTKLITGYVREIEKRDSIVICEVPDERIPQKSGAKVNGMILKAEAERLKNVISPEDYIVVLCIDGKKTSTELLEKKISQAQDRGYNTVTFVIGGSLGLDPDIIHMADYKMSISDMTFPHQLMRVALSEQIMKMSDRIHR